MAQAIHPGWNSASSASNATVTRSRMDLILSYRIRTPTQKHGREALWPLYYCRGGEEGRFFRNRGCVPRQCARKDQESRSVMAPEIRSITIAYVLRWSLMMPITLSTKATGGHVSRRNPARARHGLLQLGLSRSIRITDNPAAARTFAAILP